jgi:RNase P subunit RPR2
MKVDFVYCRKCNKVIARSLPNTIMVRDKLYTQKVKISCVCGSKRTWIPLKGVVK